MDNKKILAIAVPAIAVLLILCLTLCSGNDGCCTSECNPLALNKDTAYREHHDAKSLRKVHLYVENSASMDGYYMNYTAYFACIDAYLLAAQEVQGGKRGEVHVAFGDTIVPFKDKSGKGFTACWKASKKNGKVVHGAYKTDAAYANNRGTSYPERIIKEVVKRTRPGEVSVFFSDFILSPGSSDGLEIENYLNRAAGEIRAAVSAKLKEKKSKDFCIALRRYVSDFDGNYYFNDDSFTPHRGKRPFFALIAGGYGEVKACLEKLPGDGNTHELLFFGEQKDIPYRMAHAAPDDCEHPDYHVHLSESEIQAWNDDKEPIYLKMNVDLSCLPLPEGFAGNKANYRVEASGGRAQLFAVERVEPFKGKADHRKNDFTHTLVLKSVHTGISAGTEVTVALALPQKDLNVWEKKLACTPKENENTIKFKSDRTLGIDRIAKAIAEAYAEQGDATARFTFRIN